MRTLQQQVHLPKIATKPFPKYPCNEPGKHPFLGHAEQQVSPNPPLYCWQQYTRMPGHHQPTRWLMMPAGRVVSTRKCVGKVPGRSRSGHSRRTSRARPVISLRPASRAGCLSASCPAVPGAAGCPGSGKVPCSNYPGRPAGTCSLILFIAHKGQGNQRFGSFGSLAKLGLCGVLAPADGWGNKVHTKGEAPWPRWPLKVPAARRGSRSSWCATWAPSRSTWACCPCSTQVRLPCADMPSTNARRASCQGPARILLYAAHACRLATPCRRLGVRAAAHAAPGGRPGARHPLLARQGIVACAPRCACAALQAASNARVAVPACRSCAQALVSETNVRKAARVGTCSCKAQMAF